MTNEREHAPAASLAAARAWQTTHADVGPDEHGTKYVCACGSFTATSYEQWDAHLARTLADIIDEGVHAAQRHNDVGSA